MNELRLKEADVLLTKLGLWLKQSQDAWREVQAKEAAADLKKALGVTADGFTDPLQAITDYFSHKNSPPVGPGAVTSEPKGPGIGSVSPAESGSCSPQATEAAP